MKENSQERAIEEACETLKRRLEEAEAIVVGAGAGLSSAAGMSYSGERFRRHFSDFERKYGFHDMYTGGFYPFKTSEEFWAYWSRFIYLNRYSPFDESVYKNLFSLLRDKEYFVLTTNVDHCFQRTGFGKERLFYTQGDYGLFQCRVPCHDKTYDNEAVVLKMRKEEKNMTIPSALVPRCPVCGEPMTMNLRCDATFVEDAGWHAADMKNLSKNIGKRKYCFSNSASAATRPASLNILFGGSPPKTNGRFTPASIWKTPMRPRRSRGALSAYAPTSER